MLRNQKDRAFSGKARAGGSGKPTKAKGNGVPFATNASRKVQQPRQLAVVLLRTKGIFQVGTTTAEQFRSQVITPTSGLVVGAASQVCAKFETWKVRSARLTYTPTCAASKAGVIAIRFDPDPNDQPPQSYEQFISTGLVKWGPQWAPLTLEIPKESLMKLVEYFVDPTAGAGPHEMSRMSCPGQIQFYTQTDTAATGIGVLSLEMDLELRTLSEMPPAAVLVAVDSSGGGTASNPLTSSTGVSVTGLNGVFSNKVQTDAPFSVKHIEANQPGLYTINTVFEGTGLGTPNNILPPGETSSGITVTQVDQVVNAAATIASVVTTILVARGSSISFNGRSYAFVDMMPYLSAATAITKVLMTVNWTPSNS